VVDLVAVARRAIQAVQQAQDASRTRNGARETGRGGGE
jgi:hypothetical protein